MGDMERQLLVELGDHVQELTRNRDDMVVGIVAAILDLYRISIERGEQTKHDAVARLSAEKAWLEMEVPGQVGAKFLDFLIATLATDKLNASDWLRGSPAGNA